MPLGGAGYNQHMELANQERRRRERIAKSKTIDPKLRRSAKLQTSTTEMERKLCEIAAQEAGMSLSDWLLSLARKELKRLTLL